MDYGCLLSGGGGCICKILVILLLWFKFSSLRPLQSRQSWSMTPFPTIHTITFSKAKAPTSSPPSPNLYLLDKATRGPDDNCRCHPDKVHHNQGHRDPRSWCPKDPWGRHVLEPEPDARWQDRKDQEQWPSRGRSWDEVVRRIEGWKRLVRRRFEEECRKQVQWKQIDDKKMRKMIRKGEIVVDNVRGKQLHSQTHSKTNTPRPMPTQAQNNIHMHAHTSHRTNCVFIEPRSS